MRRVLSVLAVLGALVLVIGHLGRWWPVGDSVAVVRLQVLALGVPVLVALWAAGGRRVALAVALMAVVSGVDAARGLWGGVPSGEGGWTLYQKNLLYLGRDPEAVLADILAADPDFVTFQETSDENDAVVFGLLERYPYRLICRGRAVGGVSIFSRFPLEQPFDGCGAAPGLALVRVALPEGRQVWLASLHLSWPWPFGQAAQVAAVEEALKALDGPVVMAGDFNMVPWGSSVRSIAKAGGMARIGGYLGSFPQFGPLVPLAIDHVMIPEGATGSVELRPLAGSDHRGLLARFSF